MNWQRPCHVGHLLAQALAPGGTHVMLVDLKKPLSKDDHFKATLVFEKAGMAEVEFDVLAIGATPSREPAGKQTHHH
jgi:copper(I)-binding protein